MLLVLILHVLGHGGILNNSSGVSGRMIWLLETLAYCAVNCYALISGYVGIYSKYRISNLVFLWLRVAFYTITITALFKVFISDSVGKAKLIAAFFPVLSNQYWYFTAYFLLFFFIPFLNLALNKLSRKVLLFLLLSIGVIITVLFPMFSSEYGDGFVLGDGYSTIWLMIVYLFGGYIRKYGLFEKAKTPLLIILYLGSGLCVRFSRMVNSYITRHILGVEKYEDMWLSYVSVFILISAISLLLLFKRMKIKKVMKRIVTFFSPLAFSVYLIHTNPLIWEYIFKDSFIWISRLPIYYMVPTVLGVSLAIFIICSAIDLVRHYLFSLLKLKPRLDYLEKRIRIKISEKYI